jgi:protein TonB
MPSENSQHEDAAGTPGSMQLLGAADIWHDYQPNPASWLNSLAVHVLAVAIIMLPFTIGQVIKPVKAISTYTDVTYISKYLPGLMGKRSGGGGGGGDRSLTPASRGAIPPFALEQLAPPMAKLPNLDPLMPVQPTLLGPPELKLPQMAVNALWGDPQGVAGPTSGGPGSTSGFGPGHKWGWGGDQPVYSVGGSVSPPVPIYKPEPTYSEEARKAKYQGTVDLWIVVDSQGNVREVRVAKPLGMGLDEKAVEAVRSWRFKPGYRNGAPVAVHVAVEVIFRLF